METPPIPDHRHILDDPAESPTQTRSALLPMPRLTLVLLGTWLLLVNSLHPRMILLGVVFSMAISWISSRFLPLTPVIHSWAAGLRFMPIFLWDLIVANLQVAFLILRVGRPLRSTWLEIPLHVSDPFAMSALASVISLTPGTVSARFDTERRVLFVHILDTADPVAEVARIKERYERPLMKVFEP
jgi:multicomponent K+:H+ antiporter subunit E